jgi:hypothetical protein
MSVNTPSQETEYEVDTSINDAKWLLGSVATLGFIVIGLGLFASTLAV